MPDKTTWEKIQARIDAQSDLNKRMDATAELLHWDDNPYQLVKPDGKTKLKDAISITPNLPKVFAHGVVSDLLGGKWQTVIEGKISGTQSHKIEEFVEDNLAQADEFLLEKFGMPSLFGWLSNHVCTRWAIGAMWISQVIDGEYTIDCLPVDMRWTPFVLGKWVAPITFLKKDELELELEKYEKIAKDGGDEAGIYTKASLAEDNEVRDFWGTDIHELWVEKKKVFTEPNHLGYPPFVIAIPATGFMFRDKGYQKHEGEDILFLNAGLYKEFARSVSLEQTSGYAGLYPAYEREVKNPTSEPSQPVPKIDESLDVREGERHIPVPRGDINRAGQTARVDLQEMITNGAPLSPKQYNTPPSAVLLAGEAEMISRLQDARKDALGVFRSQLARMMIDQVIKGEEGGAEFFVGKRGKKISYSIAKLGDPDKYTISYHLSVKSKRQELANLAMFTSVYDQLPLEWNLANILMVDDPQGIIDDLELQKAKAINPAISLLEMALKYARVANDTDDEIESELKKEQSRILTHEYVMVMKSRLQPAPQPAQAIEEVKGDGRLLAQLGGAAGALRGEAARVPTARPPEEVTQ